MADKSLPTETEVIRHAELAARFYRALEQEGGVPSSAAAVMAAMYLAGVLAREREQPHEPWEERE